METCAVPALPARRLFKAHTVVSLTGEVLVFLPTALTEADETAEPSIDS